MGCQRHAPAALPPGKRPGTHCTGGRLGPQGLSSRVWKTSRPPGFDPRTVQPVAIRYTDRPIPTDIHRRRPVLLCQSALTCTTVPFPILPTGRVDVNSTNLSAVPISRPVISFSREAPGWQAICSSCLCPGDKDLCPEITGLDDSHSRSEVLVKRKTANSIAGNLSRLCNAEAVPLITKVNA